MDEVRTDGVQTEPGEETKLVAPQPEPAKDDGVIEFDGTKKYRFKRRPDREFSSSELGAAIGRAEQYDGVMSKYQKLEKTSSEQAQELADAKAKLADYETNERLAKALQSLGTSAAKPDRGTPQAEDWLIPDDSDAGNGTSNAPNAQEIANRQDRLLRENLKQRFGNEFSSPEGFEAAVTAKIRALHEQETEKRRQEDSLEQANRTMNNALLSGLRMKAPDAEEAALKEVADLENDYISDAVKAVSLMQQGRQQDALNILFDGIDKRDAARAKHLELLAKQNSVNAERERDAEVEALSGGGLPLLDDEEELKPEFDSRKVAKKAEKRQKKAHELVDKQNMLRRSGAK